MPEWFKGALRDFFLCWRQPVTPELGRAYWSTLADCDPHDVVTAGLDLRRSAGGEWPPSASTWHQAATALDRDRRLKDSMHLGRERFWRVECQDCDDTGWVFRTCSAAGRCERAVCAQATNEQATHTFVTACPCRPTNRTYQRFRDRERTSKRTDKADGSARRGGGWNRVGAKETA